VGASVNFLARERSAAASAKTGPRRKRCATQPRIGAAGTLGHSITTVSRLMAALTLMPTGA
jgi:hypothetical protein